MNEHPESARLCAGCLTPANGEKCAQCGWNDLDNPSAQSHLPRHYILVGRYYIGRALGQGGFGVTYLAQDMKNRQPVAVKEYLPSNQCTRLTDRVTLQPYTGETQLFYKTGLDRFLDEARALEKFSSHPGVVTITDFTEANGTAYLVMKYENGYSLKDHLQAKGGKLPYDLTLKIMAPAMDALREVHSYGLLHRDISPDNIFLTHDGHVKLMDFGAARYANGEQSQALSMILKPGFAPEEQYRTRGRQGAYTDVYAVSATIYRCITGMMPPAAPDRLAGEPITPPSALCPGLPREIETALMIGMAVKSENRFQTIDQLQAALAGRGGLTPLAPPPPKPVTPPMNPPPPPPRPITSQPPVGPSPLAPPPFGGQPSASGPGFPVNPQFPGMAPPPGMWPNAGQPFAGGFNPQFPGTAWPTTGPKLYDATSVVIATIFGAPLAGGILMASNAKKLGTGNAGKLFWLGVAFTAMVLFVNLILRRVPGSFAAGVIVGVFATNSLFKSYQRMSVENHLRAGGRLKSRWAALGIGLLIGMGWWFIAGWLLSLLA